MYRNETVFYGDGTSSEMCFAFLTVYPTEALRYPNCVGIGERSVCDLAQGGGGGGGESKTTKATPTDTIEGCEWRAFINQDSSVFETMMYGLSSSCNAFGSCHPECASMLTRYRDHPCLQGNAWQAVKRELVQTHKGMLTVAYIYDSCPQVFCPECPQC